MKQLARWSPGLVGLVLLAASGQAIGTAQESKGKPKEDTVAFPKLSKKAVGIDKNEVKDAKALRRLEIWWGIGGTLGRAFRQQVDRFNESQHQLHVEVRSLAGYDGVKSELDKAFQTGDLPDAAIVEIHQIASFAVDDRIQPLDEFSSNDPTFEADDLVAGLLKNLRYRDRLYALPINRSTPILYYNKRRFADAGLNPMKPPETWQQLREMARALTSEDGTLYGFVASPSPWFFESMVWSAGGELMSGKKATFAEPGSKALQLWADMVHRDRTARQGLDPFAEFSSGQAAMFIESTALVQTLNANPGLELGTAFLPRLEDSNNAVPTGGGAAVIPAGIPAERQTAAWTFLTWFINTTQAAQWSRATGYIPVRESACILLRTEGFYRESPAFETAISQLKFAREAPQLPQWPAAWGIIGEAMASAIRDDQPVLPVMKAAEEKVQALMNSEGDPNRE